MSDKGMRDTPPPQKDLYDYYQPQDGGQQQVQGQPQGDRMPQTRGDNYNYYAQPTQAFQNEVYQQSYQQRDARAMCLPNGDRNNINMIVEGPVYIIQGGDNVNARGGQNYDYRQQGGQAYDYRQYCAPYRDAQPSYYQYPYRQGCCGGEQQVQTGYQYYDGGQQQQRYDTRGYYQRSGSEQYQRGPTYSRDDVSGGQGGYRTSRERYDGGYSGSRGPGGYDSGCYGNGGSGGYGGGDSGVNIGQIADIGFGVMDRIFAREATRDAYRHPQQQQRGYGDGGHHGGYNQGNQGYNPGQPQYGWNQSGGHYRRPPRGWQG